MCHDWIFILDFVSRECSKKKKTDSDRVVLRFKTSKAFVMTLSVNVTLHLRIEICV